MPILGEHAVVLGASMSGLLAARVLADFYRHVTVIERDELPDEPVARKGVPQARHVHSLLARGAITLGELFPGILDELAAAGAPVLYDPDMSIFYISSSGHLMLRTGHWPTSGTVTPVYQPSRPLLECHVRRRLSDFENVAIHDGQDVAGLTSTPDRDRVNGVSVVDRATGAKTTLTADLVVDAMGRAAHTPAYLEALGYGRPPEDHIVMHTTYASQAMRIPSATVHEKLTVVGPAPGRPTGLFMVGYEDDVWVFTVFGMSVHTPPRDLAAMLAFAQDYAPPHVVAAAQAGEPLAPVVTHRMPSSQWRRYDKMRRLPDGLVVAGDAMCSFNPIYGQGMSVAAMDALALQKSLRRGTADLPRRYFRTAAKSIGVAWSLAAGSDLAFPDVEGRRTAATRLTSRFSDWVLTACESDAVVLLQFTKVTGLVDPPSRLLRPAMLARVARANRRRRTRTHRRERQGVSIGP